MDQRRRNCPTGVTQGSSRNLKAGFYMERCGRSSSHGIGVVDPGAQFQDREHGALAPDPLLPVDHGTSGGEPVRQC